MASPIFEHQRKQALPVMGESIHHVRELTDEEKNKAAVTLASIALTREDPSCGLSEVLEALSLKEDVKVIRKIEP